MNQDSAIIQRIKDEREILLKAITMIPISHLKNKKTEPDGTGTYSDVFHCKWNEINVALKQLRNKAKPSQMDDIKVEAAICFKMRHPNIVTLYGLAELGNNHLGLVMEWADQGSLSDNLEEMSNEEKIKVSLCICQGLAYMHLKRIAHRDLKPENVLLFGDKAKAKISDFGTSKLMQTFAAHSTNVGTPQYSAPELMDSELYVSH